ncbi:MAG: hypothetical protein Q8829_02985 [Candidatus Phytoplasma australasiaticum]|nr:hypothetical protein [Candidatus Phytoplasma australasiaticum]
MVRPHRRTFLKLVEDGFHQVFILGLGMRNLSLLNLLFPKENVDGDSMDHGGGSSSREQLPSARKWTKSHTPDLIIGDLEAGVRNRTATSNECLYHSFQLLQVVMKWVMLMVL